MSRTESISIMNFIARTLSIALHPLLMPVYVLFFLFSSNTFFSFLPGVTKLYCYVVTVGLLLLIPLASLPLFKYFHLIRNYELEDKQERIYPIFSYCFLCFSGILVIGICCIYCDRTAIVSDIGCFTLSFFYYHFILENEYAYDGNRRSMWFFDYDSVEICRGCTW